MKYLLIFLFFILFIFLVIFLIGNYFVKYALMPNMGAEKRIVDSEDEEEVPSLPDETRTLIKEQFEKERGARDQWKKEVQFEDHEVTIQTHDGLTLVGHAVKHPASTNKWVIALHGYQSNENESTLISRHFYEAGYNVLTYGLRAHGQSEGRYIGMGYLDKDDLVAWTEALIRKYPKSEIFYHGTSMGGATVLFASGLQLPHNVKAIISDCSYSSIWAIFSQEMKTRFDMGPFPILYFAQWVAILKAGYNIRNGNVMEYVRQSVLPILFIHSKPDDFVPFSMVKELYQIKNIGDKELYVTEKGAHAEAKFAEPIVYYQRGLDFFEKYHEE